MRRLLCVSVLLLCATAAFPVGAAAQELGQALVIANSAYRHHPLDNPGRDAELVSSALRQIGFSVGTHKDVTKIEMQRLLADFNARLHKSEARIGIIYFAGHGIEVEGRNYLLPVDAALSERAGAPRQALLADEMLGSGPVPLMLVLDACRDNPFGANELYTAQGLSTMAVPEGSLVVYSTRPGTTALDGANGGNSPFASAFAKAFATRGLSIDDALATITELVYANTNGEQTPVSISALKYDFLLRGGSPADHIEIAGRTIDLNRLRKRPNPLGICVTNVPPDEWLNVRTGPSISFPILSRLAVNTCAIRSVTGCEMRGDQPFCQLEIISNLDGASHLGWASFRYLRYDEARRIITR